MGESKVLFIKEKINTKYHIFYIIQNIKYMV